MIAAIIQARSGSVRLPGKVLSDLAGCPMLVRQIERVRRARTLDHVLVATSTAAEDDELVAVLAEHVPDVGVFRGDLDDVLGRLHAAAESLASVTHVVRLTGDCPLTDPDVIDSIVTEHVRRAADYTSNSLRRTYPDGLDVEVVRRDVLAAMAREATERLDREHVTRFVCCRPERFALHSVEIEPDLSALRWVVDEPADLEVVRAVFERLGPTRPEFGLADVLALREREPELFAPNAHLPCTRDWRTILAAERGDA